MNFSLLGWLATFEGFDRGILAAIALLAVGALLIAWISVARARASIESLASTYGDSPASASLPFHTRVGPGIVAFASAAFASVALVQTAARVLDVPLDGGDPAFRFALQFGPVLALGVHVSRAPDATTAIVRSLREGTIFGAVTVATWRLSRSQSAAEALPYHLLAGAAAGFAAGIVIAFVAAASAACRRRATHDATERMLAFGAQWLCAVGSLAYAVLSSRNAPSDIAVCVSPFAGAIVLAATALVRDAARRAWIERVRRGAEGGFRVSFRVVGADLHERLAPMRSPLEPGDADGVIEWQPFALGAPFRDRPGVPLALVSLTRACRWYGDGTIITRAAVFAIAVAGTLVSALRLIETMRM